MKKSFIYLFIVVFVFGAMFLTGCGGGGQKINGVADEESEIMEEASSAAKDELPTTYLVEEEDSLWGIAAKPEIYGNKYQWPLIYDANRDILDSYETLEEGQKLIIPRNVSAVEIEAAKERADELGVPGGDETKTASVSSGDEYEGYSSYEEEGYSSYEEEEEDGVIVAGLDRDEQQVENASSSIENEVEDDYYEYDEGYEDEDEMMPTPIPEPKRATKKGGANIPLIAGILVLIGAAAAGFVMMRKKKKDEEEDDDKGDDAGILT